MIESASRPVNVAALQPVEVDRQVVVEVAGARPTDRQNVPTDDLVVGVSDVVGVDHVDSACPHPFLAADDSDHHGRVTVLPLGLQDVAYPCLARDLGESPTTIVVVDRGLVARQALPDAAPEEDQIGEVATLTAAPYGVVRRVVLETIPERVVEVGMER